MREHGDLILPVKSVVTKLRDPFIKQLLGFNLQVINVFFSVQINALGFLLNGHDGQPNVNAAVELSFLNISCAFGVLQNALVQVEISLVPTFHGPFSFLEHEAGLFLWLLNIGKTTPQTFNDLPAVLSAVMFGGRTAIAVRWRRDFLGHGGTFFLGTHLVLR